MHLDEGNKETILVVHSSDRVRDAIHESLGRLHALSFAPNVEDARTHCRRERPSAVVVRFDANAMDWAIDLHSRDLVPVVFFFLKNDDMSLYADARTLGLVHYVQLPDDLPSSWEKEFERIGATVQHSIEATVSRRNLFARSTSIQPAISQDLAASGAPRWAWAAAEDNRKRKRARVGRTTIVKEITPDLLAAALSADHETDEQAKDVQELRAPARGTKRKASKVAKGKKRRPKKKRLADTTAHE